MNDELDRLGSQADGFSVMLLGASLSAGTAEGLLRGTRGPRAQQLRQEGYLALFVAETSHLRCPHPRAFGALSVLRGTSRGRLGHSGPVGNCPLQFHWPSSAQQKELEANSANARPPGPTSAGASGGSGCLHRSRPHCPARGWSSRPGTGLQRAVKLAVVPWDWWEEDLGVLEGCGALAGERRLP